MGENENKARALTLTRTELLFLDDALPRGFFSRMGRTDPGHIIEKICLATLKSETSGTVRVELSEVDLWLLRDLCRHDDFFNDEPVGHSIRKKIYSTLFRRELEDAETVAQLLAEINLN